MWRHVFVSRRNKMWRHVTYFSKCVTFTYFETFFVMYNVFYSSQIDLYHDQCEIRGHMHVNTNLYMHVWYSQWHIWWYMHIRYSYWCETWVLRRICISDRTTHAIKAHCQRHSMHRHTAPNHKTREHLRTWREYSSIENQRSQINPLTLLYYKLWISEFEFPTSIAHTGRGQRVT